MVFWYNRICTWEDALSEAGSKDDAVILLIHVQAARGLWKAVEKFISFLDPREILLVTKCPHEAPVSWGPVGVTGS